MVSGPLGREKAHYEAPDAGRLDAEMKSFLDWFNAENTTDPIVKAALAHLWFVTIHPFDDGNGRIARAIADMCLARSEESSILPETVRNPRLLLPVSAPPSPKFGRVAGGEGLSSGEKGI